MQVRKDIVLFVGNTLSNVKKCPTTVSTKNPIFQWILPDDLKGKQTRFCLQMRTVDKHDLSNGSYDYSFYQSGNISSTQNYFQWAYGGVGMLESSWRGAICLRLFIATSGDLNDPFEYVSDEEYLEGISWQENNYKIKDDNKYCVLDTQAEIITNYDDIICKWKNSIDPDINQNLTYFAQLCESPLFGELDSYYKVFEYNINDSKKIFTQLQATVELNKKYFFRVRAFDGYDYSNWSVINGFFTSSNEKPIFQILSVNPTYNEYGDVIIKFRVQDKEQEFITLQFSYSGGSVAEYDRKCPTLLEATQFFHITKDYTDEEGNVVYGNNGYGEVIWRSSLNEKINANNFYLYMNGNDGIDVGEEYVYGAFSLDNLIYDKQITGAGSYFLNFPTNGIVKIIDKEEKEYSDDYPTTGRVGKLKEYEYDGYNNDKEPFENKTTWGRLYPEVSNNFISNLPKTLYQKIYQYSKYMIYDTDIPTENNSEESNADKLEKDPYVIFKDYNPTLNVDEKGKNKTVVYISDEKIEGELPNGEWYTSIEDIQGFDSQGNYKTYYQYIRIWGDEYQLNNLYPLSVFEDNEEAPQYTLDPFDYQENGYPKPIPWEKYEEIGNKPIYIKKYRVELGYAGEPKNFTVVNENGKWVRKYFAIRGKAPIIVNENGELFYSYNGELIDKYDPESSDFSGSLPEDFPEDAKHLPINLWQKKIQIQAIAVPYYVLSTEAIYRPNDHKSGNVGKTPLFDIYGWQGKQELKSYDEKTPPVIGWEGKRTDYEIGGPIKNLQDDWRISDDGNVYFIEDGKLVPFILKDDDINSFLNRNPNYIVKIDLKNNFIEIFKFSNYKKINEIVKDVEPKELYFSYKDFEEDENGKIRFVDLWRKNPPNQYFELEIEFLKIVTPVIKIDLTNNDFYIYNSSTKSYILYSPTVYISVNGELVKSQRYIPDTRRYGTNDEKFPDLDFPFFSRIGEGEKLYLSGISGIPDRPEVVDDYNRPLRIIGEIKTANSLKELNIIYLQYFWDSYNQLHWQGTLGNRTYIRLEYTKLINGKEQEWKDLITESSQYFDEYGFWLIPPVSYDEFIDNFNYEQFEDKESYRIRISTYDFLQYPTITGPIVATPDFVIDNDAINPFVIESLSYNAWTKNLEITFRVDDLQGDLYDIIQAKYSLDDKTWYEIPIDDFVGKIENLESNTLRNRQTNQIIRHKIYWNISNIIFSSTNIRIQLIGTLSSLNVDYDIPIFSWICWNNQSIKLAEDEENYILGSWVRYEQVDSENGEIAWRELSEPYRNVGQLSRVNDEVEEIYEEYEKYNGEKSFDEWLQSTYSDGITLAEKLQILNNELSDLQNRLNESKRLRFKGETFIRKNLILQGFYSNGFIENDPNKGVFEYKVLNLPSSGHVSDINWDSSNYEIIKNGDFSENSENILNYNKLLQLGFIINLPFPEYWNIDVYSDPAIVGIYSSDGTNFISVDNITQTKNYKDLNNVITEENIETNIYTNIGDWKTACYGKYIISFDGICLENNKQNKIKVYLERYNSNQRDPMNLLSKNLLGEVNFDSLTSRNFIFSYSDIDSEIISKTEQASILFTCSGQVAFGNVSLKIDEIVEEDSSSSSSSSDNNIYLDTFRVIGDVGNKSYNKFMSDVITEDPYIVYYRFQLDFFDTFDSQNNRPLRDIIFANMTSVGELPSDINESEVEYTRIRGGTVRSGVFRVNQDVTNAVPESGLSYIEQIREDGKEMETGNEIENNENQVITFDPNNDKRKYGNVAISKNDLPGEWKKGSEKFINLSYPDVVDINVWNSSTFNGEYFWRFAPYNVVLCDYIEISHSIISNISIGSNNATIEIKSISNENISELYFTGKYWLSTEKLEKEQWIFDRKKEVLNENTIDDSFNLGTVSFPTDPPRDESGNVIRGDNTISLFPTSLDRNRPFVIKMNTLDYFIWYSKTSLLKQNVIVQGTGKNPLHFAELGQCYPSYVLDKMNDYISMFSPCALAVDVAKNTEFESSIEPENKRNLEAKITVLSSDKTNSFIDSEIFVENKNTEFFSDLESFIQVKAKKQNIYLFYLWITVQTSSGMDIILMKSDKDLVTFSEPIKCSGLKNCYHPCVIEKDDKFIMLCCKTYNNYSQIFSFESNDGVDWTKLNGGNPSIIKNNNLCSPSILFDEEKSKYQVFLTEYDSNNNCKIVSYLTEDFITFSDYKVEIDNEFKIQITENSFSEENFVTFKNPRNCCVINEVYYANKIKRMYFNVDCIYKDRKETLIKTMILEDRIWKEGNEEAIWGQKDMICSLFGKQHILNVDLNKNGINPKNNSNLKIRLEIELSPDYNTNQKECMLQGEWINKDNYELYDAEINPNRNFRYNSLVKNKKYSGE